MDELKNEIKLFIKEGYITKEDGEHLLEGIKIICN